MNTRIQTVQHVSVDVVDQSTFINRVCRVGDREYTGSLLVHRRVLVYLRITAAHTHTSYNSYVYYINICVCMCAFTYIIMYTHRAFSLSRVACAVQSDITG